MRTAKPRIHDLSDPAQPQNLGARSSGHTFRDRSAKQPELPDSRSPAGNPPFIRRCLTAALQLLGLTHRDLFAYAVLVSHCRAYVDGDHGTCRLYYTTWATESGVWKPKKPDETPEAAKKRLQSAQREMRTIASRLKKARLLLVKKRARSSELIVFPPGQIGVKHPYLDRGKTPLSKERRSLKGNLSDSNAAAAVVPDDRQQQQQRRINVRVEGLIGACAVRARKLKRPIDEALERKRLAAGEIDVEDIQRMADELQDAIDERDERGRRGGR